MRLLSDLVGGEIDALRLQGNWGETEIHGITADSRAVKQGFIFAAMAGVKLDGRQFIETAIAQGAAAILTDFVPEGVATGNVPVLYAANTRHALAMLASRFNGRQPKWMVAVTGTDGKTSTAHFFQQIWNAMGHPAASIGTLGVTSEVALPDYPALHTTPDPVLLHKILGELPAHHIEHVAMEASSHGLDQHRLDGVRVKVAGFTNLTRDHLDYHHTEENYYHAKRRLFAEVVQGGGTAVLNADDARFEDLKQTCKAESLHVMAYGKNGDALRLVSSVPHALGQQVTVEIQGRRMELDIPLIGGFQVLNILCAAGMSLACGADVDALAKAISTLSGVPGRLERVAEHSNGAPILIDYAHTPGGLESMLRFVRPHVEKRLVLVFGCGGDRDRGKRPIMGKIAAELADVAIVTDDNPRTEDAASIRKEVMQGCPKATEVAGRMEAITAAVKQLRAGDALVIAGKGHEKMQIIGTTQHPFDDGEVARMAVQMLTGQEAH